MTGLCAIVLRPAPGRAERRVPRPTVLRWRRREPGAPRSALSGGQPKCDDEDDDRADGDHGIEGPPRHDPVAAARPRSEGTGVHREGQPIAVPDREDEQPNEYPRAPRSAESADPPGLAQGRQVLAEPGHGL